MSWLLHNLFLLCLLFNKTGRSQFIFNPLQEWKISLTSCRNNCKFCVKVFCESHVECARKRKSPNRFSFNLEKYGSDYGDSLSQRKFIDKKVMSCVKMCSIKNFGREKMWLQQPDVAVFCWYHHFGCGKWISFPVLILSQRAEKFALIIFLSNFPYKLRWKSVLSLVVCFKL